MINNSYIRDASIVVLKYFVTFMTIKW